MLKRIALLLVLCSPATAQPAPGAAGPFAPIVLDETKFSLLYGQLRQIPMSADAHERIAEIMVQMRRQALMDQVRSKPPTPQDSGATSKP